MSEDLITNTKWKFIPEREREALMRLTMCARGECGMCKYEDTCVFDFQCELATKNMNILADALRAEQTEPSNRIVEKHSTPIRDIMIGKTEPEEEIHIDKPRGYTLKTDTDCAWK